MKSVQVGIIGLVIILSACQTTPRKTPEQIKLEANQKFSEIAKASGMSQSDIDAMNAYQPKAYKERLEDRVADYNTPAGNFLSLLDMSLSTCEQIRGFIKDSFSEELARDNANKLFYCALDSSSVLTKYYYQSVIKKGDQSTEAVLLQDAFIKWSAYSKGVTSKVSAEALDRLASEVSSAHLKANLSVIRSKSQVKK